MQPDHWLGLALLSVAGATISLALVRPRVVEDPVMRGRRLARRQSSLAGSAAMRLVWPLVTALAPIFRASAPLALCRRCGELLIQAGEPAGLDAAEFLVLGALSTAGGTTAGALAGHALTLGGGATVLGLFLGLALPMLWLRERAATRLQAIDRALPDALDLIVLGMSAGLDFIAAVQHVVDREGVAGDALASEITWFLRGLTLGQTRREALTELSARAPTPLMQAFVANVVEADRRGTPLVEVLRVQADVARTRRLQAAEKMAARAGVVILLPLTLIFAATVLVLFGSMIVKGCRGDVF